MPIKTPDESPQAVLPVEPEEEQSFPPGKLPPLGSPLARVAPARGLRVRDIMTRKVFTTFPDASLLDAALEMYHHHVTGLPVVGPEGQALGVVTETDVMRTLGAEPKTSALSLILPVGQGRTDPVPARELREVQALLTKTHVGEAMTPDPVVISSEQSVADAVRLLLDERVNRLPVVDNGRLVGILTRNDVLRGVAPSPPA